MSFIAEYLAKRFAAVRGGMAMRRGEAAMSRGDGSTAVAEFTKAVEAKTAILEARHVTVAKAMNELAGAHRLNGNLVAATDMLTEVVDIYQEKLSSSDPNIPITMNNLAVMLRNTRKVSSATGIAC